MELTPERWARIQAVFHFVAGAPQQERAGLLEEACGGDQDLKDAVVRLLEADRRDDGSLLDDELEDLAHRMFGPLPAPAEVQPAFGPYRVVRPLGEGGMGVVFLAHRADLGQYAAVKVLRDVWVSPAGRQRFASEQRALARLTHPSIARLYHADTLADGTPWFAMEYVEGRSLTEYCEQQGQTVAGRLRLFREVSEAVRHAHQQLIIHRDLKPSNILVTPAGAVKLLDFGIAKQLDEADRAADHSRTAFRFLTPNYAAPEQLTGAPVGVPTDVYSLGVILYELLTGRLPFELTGLSPGEAEARVTRQQPERPSLLARSSQAARSVSRASWDDLDVICLTAMHRDPARRYQSAEALIRDLDHYRRGEPLEARPDSLGYRAGKFVRRNARPLAAAALALTLAGALVTFYTLRLAEAHRLAQAETSRAERIQEFMLNLFDAGERDAAPSNDLRVVTLVDRGVQEARSLDGEPVIQAALYHTLGVLYQRLANYDRADEILTTALELRRRLLGPDHPDTLETLIAVGLLRVDQARLEQAEQLVREALELGGRALGERHRVIARATAALGKVLEERGVYTEAIPLLERAAELFARTGSRQPETDLAAALSELANTHFYAGNLGQSEALNRRVLEINRRLRGGRHPNVADDLLNLGAIESTRERYEEATKYYREALDILRSWYGDDHPQTASAMTILAQGLYNQSQYEEASALLGKALATQERVHGPVHRRVGFVLNEIGIVALRRERLEEAERAFRRSLEVNQKVYSGPHFRIGVSFANLGSVYLAAKKYLRAERAFRQALEIYEQALPAGHLRTAIARINLGRALARQRRYEDAEAHLAAASGALATQPAPPESWLRLAREELASIYDALDQPERAAHHRGLLDSREPPGGQDP